MGLASLRVRLLITGASGHLGRELARQALAGGHEVSGTYLTRVPAVDGLRWYRLEIRDREAVAEILAEARPDVVVHTAFQQHDWATTADGAIYIALAAANVGAGLVHVSTDAVFSGSAYSYDETATLDPITPYGAAKAAAETAIRAVHPAAAIARTSLIVGDGKSAHEAQVRDLVTGRRAGALFTDDIRCPVQVADLAAGLLELATDRRAGTYHLAGADALSRYEFGLLVARREGLDAAQLRAGLRAASTIPGPIAIRLDCTRTQESLRTRLRGAREFLAEPIGQATT